MSPEPLAPISGKRVTLDPSLSPEERSGLRSRLTILGATLVPGEQGVDLRILAPHTLPALVLHAPGEKLLSLDQLEPYLIPHRDALVWRIRHAGWRSLLPLNAAGIELDLTGADLSDTDLTGFYLPHTSLQRVNLTDALLTGAYLNRPREVDFTSVGSLAEATLYAPEDCDFTGLDLTGVRLHGRVVRCGFQEAVVPSDLLREFSPYRCDFSRVDFQGADLTGWVAGQSILREANFQGATFRGADLRQANLTGANLSGANVEDADFTGAILEGVNWVGAETEKAIGWVLSASQPRVESPTPESATLRELAETLAGTDTWYLRVSLALTQGDRIDLVLGQQERTYQARVGVIDEARRCGSLAELFRFPAQFHQARPILESLEIRPIWLERNHRAVLLRALHEAVGRYCPSKESLCQAHRERLESARQMRRKSLLDLRQGVEGVDTWNRAYAERPSALRALRRVHLAGCDLRGIDLHEARAAQGNFVGANLTGACLRSAWLTRANFRRANLYQIKAGKAILRGADLSRTQLRFADLSGANLSNANLWGASLVGACLEGARLHGADLRWAMLSFANLKDVRYDHTTRFPNRFHPELGLNDPTRAPEMHRALVRAGAPLNRLMLATQAYLEGCRPHHIELSKEQATALIPNPTRTEIHACRLTWQGHHECANDHLQRCSEVNQGVCSHLLLLLLCLPELQPGTGASTLGWFEKAIMQRPKNNEYEMASILLRGEIQQESDFRPAEMLPEDYYAL